MRTATNNISQPHWKKMKINNQEYEMMYIDSDRITKTTPNEMNIDNKYDTTKICITSVAK